MTARLKSTDLVNLEGVVSRKEAEEGRRVKLNSTEFQRLADGRRRPAPWIEWTKVSEIGEEVSEEEATSDLVSDMAV